MDKIRIEKAEAGDIDMVAILVHQLIKESFSVEHQPSPKQIQHAAEELLEKGNAMALIAYVNDKAVGVMTLTEAVAMHARGKFGIIMEFFVLPDARSKGIGVKLLEYVNRLALKNRWRWIEVCVPQGGEAKKSEEFFTNSGFSNTGPSLRKFM